MKHLFTIMSLITLLSTSAFAGTRPAPLCEIGETRTGALAVFSGGQQITHSQYFAQNLVMNDLLSMIKAGLCRTEPAPCQTMSYTDSEGKEGTAIERNGVRISALWNGLPDFVISDLRTLQDLGLCEK